MREQQQEIAPYTFAKIIYLIDSAISKEQIKTIVDFVDGIWRQDLIEISEENWPELSLTVANRIGKPFPDIIKRCWTVILKSGKQCTMIIELECDQNEALEAARHRFFNDVLIVN